MFAVVALRSTTVLATMESVSGDTAVDHGGDVAHIRGRKLLALLPERYEAHPEFSCAGRNELGMLTLSLAECAAKCEEYPTCISFDFKTPTADWTSTSAYSCNLSETCTKELAATDLAHTLFVKLPATTVFLSAKLTAGDGAVEDMFGNNVMIDGDTIVIAANYDDDKEQLGGYWTRVRHLPSGSPGWHPSTDRLAGTDIYGDSSDDGVAWSIDFESAAPGYDQFLFASGDGSLWLVASKSAVVGEFYGLQDLRDVISSSSNAGEHQVKWYNEDYDQCPWISLEDHANSDPGILYGAESQSINSNFMKVVRNYGGADVYIRSSSGLLQRAKLTAGDGAASDYFGRGVSIDGDTMVISASEDDDDGSMSGSAYVFTRVTAGDLASGWTQVAKLTAGDGAYSDGFGISVSIDGDTVVIGAWADDDNGSNSGSAYVFTRVTAGDLASGWTQVAKLTADDGAEGDYFGISVSIDGDTVVVGALGRRQGIQERVRVRVHARHGRRPHLRLDAGCQADRGRRRCGVTGSAPASRSTATRL